MADTTNYAVRFNVVRTETKYVPRTKIVTITEGYSTFEDIRKILSLTLSVKPNNIDILALTKVTEEN